MDCVECFRLLCKILAGAEPKQGYQAQLTQHQVEVHRRTEAALFPGKLVRTDAPKPKEWQR